MIWSLIALRASSAHTVSSFNALYCLPKTLHHGDTERCEMNMHVKLLTIAFRKTTSQTL
jgi:hypothetical protein